MDEAPTPRCNHGYSVMTTSSEHAKNATAELHKVFDVSPGDFDVDRAAEVIDLAIRNATCERDIRASQQLREAQAAAQEWLARLLSASPAVIYSFKATADFAPTFISDNITSVFGYTPAEYLTDPSFRAIGSTPAIRPALRRLYLHFSTMGFTPSSIGFVTRTAPIAGCTTCSI